MAGNTPGDRIGRYEIVRRLASGGMAEIFLARHEGPNGFRKLVVIKEVLPEIEQAEGFKEMFLDEARLSGRLQHPNIAQTFELGEQDGRYYLAMEYVEGESLDRLVKRARAQNVTLPLPAILRVVMMVLEALDYSHDLEGEQGEWLKVVHRDVSPSNVVLTYYGSVKLLDFGIARAVIHEHHTQNGKVKGKGGYMSPEQAAGKPVDLRTDIYAAGSLLYYLSTGRGPFEQYGTSLLMMLATVEGRFPNPRAIKPELPLDLERIILKAMALRPDQRYSTAGQMLDELEKYATSHRLFPGARSLAGVMRDIFPGRVGLSRSWEQMPSAALMDKLAESFAGSEEAALGAASAEEEPTRPRTPLLPHLPLAPIASSEPQRATLPEPSPRGAAFIAAARSVASVAFDDDAPENDPTIQVSDPKLLHAAPPTLPVPGVPPIPQPAGSPRPTTPDLVPELAEKTRSIDPFPKAEQDKTVSMLPLPTVAASPVPPAAHAVKTQSVLIHTRDERGATIGSPPQFGPPEVTDDATRAVTRRGRDALGKESWTFAIVGLLVIGLGLLLLKLLGG